MSSSNVIVVQPVQYEVVATAPQEVTVQTNASIEVVSVGIQPVGVVLTGQSNTFLGIQTLNVQDSGGQVFNVRAFGTVGNPTGDDATINAALTAAKNAGGGTLFFTPGSYYLANPLNLSSTNNITLLGSINSNRTGSSGIANLIYVGTGTSSPFNLQNARAITLQNLGLQWNQSGFTGYLIDVRNLINPSSNTTNITLVDCTISPTSSSLWANLPALLILDGAYAVNLLRCRFQGGQYCLYGKLTAAGFTNDVNITDCNFQNFINYAICALDQSSLILNCVCEPNTSNAAGFVTYGLDATNGNAPIPMNTLTIDSCWLGDDRAGNVGTWINWYGNGLSVRGTEIGCQTATTGITFGQNSCHGAVITGNVFTGSGGASKAISFGATSGHTGFVELGNYASNVTNFYSGSMPTGAIYEAGSTPTIDSLNLTGDISVTSLTASGDVSGLAGIFGGISPNLLTQQDADLEGSGVGHWQSNAGPVLVANVTSVPAAHGTHVLQVTSNNGGANNSISVNLGGVVAGQRGFVDVSGYPVGSSYTALASCRAATTIRNIQLELNAYDQNLLAQRFANTGSTTGETTTGWKQLTITGTAPATITASGLPVKYVGVVFRWNATAGNVAQGEVHYLDTISIAFNNTSQIWQVPGNTTTTVSYTLVQSASGDDMTIAANGASSTMIVNPVGGGALGTKIGDGNQIIESIVNGTDTIQAGSDANIALIVKRHTATQTANIQEWQMNTGGTLASIDPSGNATFPGLTVGTLSGVLKGTTGAVGTAAQSDIEAALGSQAQNLVLASPNGSSGTATFRALTTTDLPAGTGTVTSVAMTVPSDLTVTGSPVTTSGTLAVTRNDQNANTFLAGPSTGVPATPAYRALTTTDLPAGTGTVTSVALTLPSDLTVTGSPVTTSGTLAVSRNNQSPNFVLAGPSDPVAPDAPPTFRTLHLEDMPFGVAQFGLANTFTACPQQITIDDDAHAGLVIHAHSHTQTANLLQFRSASPAPATIAYVDANGNLSTPALLGQVEIDAHYGTITADTAVAGTFTFDLAVTDKHSCTLGVSNTFALANVKVGQTFTLYISQDGTGGRTVTWFSGIRWSNGVAPVLTTTGSKMDIATFTCISAGSYVGTVLYNF